MADKKNRDDLADDFPEIGDSSSDESVSLEAFPDDIDFPEPEGAPDFPDGSSVDEDPLKDDFGDLEDSFPDDTSEGEAAASSEEDGDDWGDDQESEEAAADGDDDDDDDGSLGEDGDYEDEEEQKLGLVDKLKQQAIPLGAGVLLLGFVSYVALDMFFPSPPANTGGGYAPPPQVVAPPPQPPSAPPTGPVGSEGMAAPGGSMAVAPPSLPTGPAPGGNMPPPPAVGADFPPPQMAEIPPPSAGGDLFPPQLPGSQQQGDEFHNSHGDGHDDMPFYGFPGHDEGANLRDAGVQATDFIPVSGLSDVIASSMEEVVGHRFNQMLDRMDSFSSELSDLSLSLNRVDDRIDDLDFEVAEVRQGMQEVDNKVEEYLLRVEDLELRLDNLEINSRVATGHSEEEMVVAVTLPDDEAVSLPPVDEPVLPADAGTAEAVAEPAPSVPVAQPKPQKKAAPSKPRAPRQAAVPAPSRPAVGGSLTPPGKPLVIDGYYLKGVSRGLAWIDTGRGIIRAGVGQEIEGLGRIRRIAQQGQGDWMVVTDAGLILP